MLDIASNSGNKYETGKKKKTGNFAPIKLRMKKEKEKREIT